MTTFALLSVLSAGLILMGSDITAGAKYFKVKRPMTWSEALSSCKTNGGWPASIKTAVEQSEVSKSALDAKTTWAQGNGYWIGLRQETSDGGYIWNVDSSIATYFNWHPSGEPSHGGWNSAVYPLCIAVTWQGLWMDINCEDVEEGVICEYLSTTTTTTTTTSSTRSTATTSTTKSTTSSTTPQTTTTPEATSTTNTTTTRISSEGTTTPPRATVTKRKSSELSLQSLMPSLEGQRSRMLDNTRAIGQQCDDFDASRAAPPPDASGEAKKIKIGFEVVNLRGISTTEETISVSAAIFMNWNVTTCPANSSTAVSDRPYEEIAVSDDDNIWKPRISFVSSAESDLFLQNLAAGEDFTVLAKKRDTRTYENRTYEFYWLRKGWFVSDCPLQLDNFPFDTQTCTFEFALQRDINLITFGDVIFPFDNEAVANTEWKLRQGGTQFSLCTQKSMGHQVATVRFTATFQRIPTYYIQTFYVPCSALTALVLTSFFMPPEVPDRVAITATMVLALTVAQTAVLGQVPKKPGGNMLSRFVDSMIWFSIGCTIYEMLALWLACSVFSEKQRPAPRFCGKRIHLDRVVDFVAFLAALGTFVYFNGTFLGYMW